MPEAKKISTPLTDEVIAQLKAGDNVLINGTIYTGRDAAHKKLADLISGGAALPFDLRGQIIFYVGPTPARPGNPIGSAGPTTSYRMDAYAAKLHELGLKASIGKGSRNAEVKDSLKKFKAVYMAVTGGAAALVSKSIKKAEVVAYPELGPEAIQKLEVENFPAQVINDMYGGDIYEEGRRQYERN
ncbi:MAG: Fe-S-containing hydro-lyase [Chrysiogenales bacterium]|nr:Fe-S-containing hydro-lyase [Candidatus Aminicenantes bacterium]TFG80922.1 MAG: Fe-S-containing hydro-lyase [Chrysiogenales bacterium]